MVYTIKFIQGQNVWVVEDNTGKWLITCEDEEDAKAYVQELKDQERQISFLF